MLGNVFVDVIVARLLPLLAQKGLFLDWTECIVIYIYIYKDVCFKFMWSSPG